VAERLRVFRELEPHQLGSAEQLGEVDAGDVPKPGGEIEIAGAVWIVTSIQAGRITVKPKAPE
jgi:hypothetical protein